MRTFAALVRKYRWLVVGLSIGVLWLLGYTSLTYIKNTSDTAVLSDNVEADDFQPQKTLSQEVAVDESERSGVEVSDGENTAVIPTEIEDTIANCRRLDKTQLKAWLERELAAGSTKYKSALSKLNIEAVQHVLEPGWLERETEKLLKVLTADQERASSEHKRLLEQPEC